MHYINGRAAKVGDTVITKDYNGIPTAGVVVACNAQSDTCNLTVVPIPMQCTSYCVTAKEAIHSEDAFAVNAPASAGYDPVPEG